MAARRPVIATAVGGLPELVEHGESGLLAPSRDDISIAASLIELYRRPDVRERMAKVAVQRAVKNFSLDGMLNGYREVYREVLNGQPGRSLHRRENGPRVRSKANPGGDS